MSLELRLSTLRQLRTLGPSMLPKLWRRNVDMQNGTELWRPVVLAMHELLHQTEKLESRLALRLCA